MMHHEAYQTGDRWPERSPFFLTLGGENRRTTRLSPGLLENVGKSVTGDKEGTDGTDPISFVRVEFPILCRYRGPHLVGV